MTITKMTQGVEWRNAQYDQHKSAEVQIEHSLQLIDVINTPVK